MGNCKRDNLNTPRTNCLLETKKNNYFSVFVLFLPHFSYMMGRFISRASKIRTGPHPWIIGCWYWKLPKLTVGYEFIFTLYRNFSLTFWKNINFEGYSKHWRKIPLNGPSKKSTELPSAGPTYFPHWGNAHQIWGLLNAANTVKHTPITSIVFRTPKKCLLHPKLHSPHPVFLLWARSSTSMFCKASSVKTWGKAPSRMPSGCAKKCRKNKLPMSWNIGNNLPWKNNMKRSSR